MSAFHWSPKSELLRYSLSTPRPAGTAAIVTLWVDSCLDLDNADVLDKSDPYVVIGLKNEDEISQEQRSRTQTNTSDPMYTPGERFEFAVQGTEKLILSVYDEDTITKDDLLAHGVIDIENVLSSTKHEKQPLLGKDSSLDLFSPKGGHVLRSKCLIRIRWDPPEFAGAIREDIIIQHERYNIGNPLTSKKGSWSADHLHWKSHGKCHRDRPPWLWFAADGNHKEAHTFEDALPELPPEFTIVKDFYNQGKHGWEYAPGFCKSDNNWRPATSMACFVRRRIWHRVSVLPALPFSAITTFDHGSSFGVGLNEDDNDTTTS